MSEFSDAMKRFEAHQVSAGFARETIVNYRSGLRLLAGYLALMEIEKLSEITPEVIEGFVYYLHCVGSSEGDRYSPVTLHGYFAGLRSFFKWAVLSQLMIDNPTKRLVRPKRPNALPRTLPSPEDIEKLLAEPDTGTSEGYRNRALLELLYGTGLRPKEARMLDLADVDCDGGTLLIRQGKPRKDRYAVLLPRVAEVLSGYISGPREFLARRRPDEPALFVSRQARRMSVNQVNRIVRRSRERAGIEKEITPIAIRHAIATHLLAAGLGVRQIQVFLGHRSIETTTIYAKVTPVDLQNQVRRFHPKQKARRKPRDV